MKKLLIAIMSVIMAFGAPVIAMADDAHFTFTNFEEDQPDLYVYKSVSSALDGYTVPDTEFTFVLKWDQDGDGYLEFAENVMYYIYNADGSQVFNEDNSSYIFRTSSTGRFTLKDGQYARFEWAGQVEYEITELGIENFTQTSPAGGEAASGTVDASGTIVEFDNLYIPPDTGGGDEPEYTQLAVRKDISWPYGYEMPDFSDTEFTFEIKIDGSAYSNEAYTIYDSSMTNELGSGRTESDGTFTLTGGQLALFEEVEVGVDYEITETNMDTGWRAVGNTFYGGSTTAPIVYAYFANAGAEFVVEKDRTDGVVGTEFKFILSDMSNAPLSNVSYYVYDESGNLTGSYKTDENGEFTLCAGERIIFVGLADSTEYKITENAGDSFIVTADSKNDADEITDEVDYNSVDTHTFVNEELTDITITKYGSRLNTEKNLLEGAEFTAYILNENGEYEQYGDPLTTDGSGVLTFKNLPAGTYRIVETKTPAGYVSAGEPIEVTLPYTVTNETEGAVYSKRDGVYYIYSLNYTVDNTAVLEMPNTGGWTWLIIVLVIAGGCVAGVALRYYFKNHPRNKGVIA